MNNRIRSALVVLAASAGLGACTGLGPYGGVGVGVSSGYGAYGYPYGYGYGSPYYGSYYNRYPHYGWYDGFYYPGAGHWVYDPYGRYYPINEKQSRYWQEMLAKARAARGGTTATATARENWSGFGAQGKVAAPVSAGGTVQADEGSRRQIMQARRQQAQAESRQVRSETRSEIRSETRSTIRQRIMEQRAARRAAQPSGE
jgi:hypothetical protein